MRRSNGWLALSFAGIVAMASAACDNTAAGAKKDSEIAAEQAREAGDTAAAAASDAARDAAAAGERATEDASAATAAAATTTSVKSALMADRRVDASGIDVDTDAATKVVTLKGSVPTAAQKATAESIARDKAEGYTIVNDLTVS